MILLNILKWLKGVFMGTIARNPITGRAIKTDPPNAKYAAGRDHIFTKKTAHEWLKETPEDIWIMSPDGWEWDDGVTMDTPIKRSDFNNRLNHNRLNHNRLNHSTVIGSIK